MARIVFIFLGLLLTVTNNAYSQTMTAVCKEPKGFTFVFKDGSFHGAADGISGAHLSYSWDVATKRATIITQHSAAMDGVGTPISYPAQVIHISKRRVVFLVTFEKGVEMHSLFLDDRVVYFSSQKDMSDLRPGSSSGKIFSAKCKIGMN